MPSNYRKQWTVNDICTIIAALGSAIAVVIGAMNNRRSEENGERINHVSSQQEQIKDKTVATEEKVNNIEKTTKQTASVVSTVDEKLGSMK